MSDMTQQQIPSIVLETAKQDGEAELRKRWAWAETAVWTPRMLGALEQGVKGGVWYSLMDKVYAQGNLQAAAKKVVSKKGSAGVDHVTVRMFDKNLGTNLEQMQAQLRTGKLQPQAVRRVYIPKPGSRELRPLGIPTVRDRIVQTALRSVLEPIFERTFSEYSYGFRPGRGCKDALRRVTELLRRGYLWVVDVDIKSYFDTITHDKLLSRIKQQVADGRILDLIESYLKQHVLDTMKDWEPEEGTPQGAVISPLLANIYLNPLDHEMMAEGYQMTRYADDMVVQCRDEQEAEQVLMLLSRWTEAAGLELHPTKTRIVRVTEQDGFDFLGYHFELSKRTPNKLVRWPRKKSMKRFKDGVRAATRRLNGNSLEVIIKILNPKLRGFFEYFKQSNAWTFQRLDGWIRGRLRAILRRRAHLRGRANGRDHQRWPNAHFQKHGLFSMARERAELLQPSMR